MIPTEKMIDTIPAKDAWKDFKKDKRKKTFNVVPKFHRILYAFDPEELPEEHLDEFRRRIHYTNDDYFLQHRNDCKLYQIMSLTSFRVMDKEYIAEKKLYSLGRSYEKLLFATDDYRDGKIGDDEMRKAYLRTRKILIEAIGAKAAAYITRLDAKTEWQKEKASSDL